MSTDGAGLTRFLPYSLQGEYDKAELLYARCQAIQEKVLGPDHPNLATTLNNRAVLLGSQVSGLPRARGDHLQVFECFSHRECCHLLAEIRGR